MSIVKIMFAAALLVASAGVARCDPNDCEEMTNAEQANDRGCPVAMPA